MFVVGAGNYIEYQNLQDYCKRQQSVRKVTYGTSELVNPHQFLAQASHMTVTRAGHAYSLLLTAVRIGEEKELIVMGDTNIKICTVYSISISLNCNSHVPGMNGVHQEGVSMFRHIKCKYSRGGMPSTTGYTIQYIEGCGQK